MAFQFRDEAIEEDLNRTFRSQGQGNPQQYYNLSQTVVPTYSINDVAEGSGLPVELQQAWDFATQLVTVANNQPVLTSTPGFYKLELVLDLGDAGPVANTFANIRINDGSTLTTVWRWSEANSAAVNQTVTGQLIVFLRSGDSLQAQTNRTDHVMNIWYRQIATLNGTLVNPLGYSAA